MTGVALEPATPSSAPLPEASMHTDVKTATKTATTSSPMVGDDRDKRVQTLHSLMYAEGVSTCQVDEESGAQYVC